MIRFHKLSVQKLLICLLKVSGCISLSKSLYVHVAVNPQMLASRLVPVVGGSHTYSMLQTISNFRCLIGPMASMATAATDVKPFYYQDVLQQEAKPSVPWKKLTGISKDN